MELAKYFTNEEKQQFFEHIGYTVAMREFGAEIRLTHSWYEWEMTDELAVEVNEKWYKLNSLFEKVMIRKLKDLLIGQSTANYKIVEEIVNEL